MQVLDVRTKEDFIRFLEEMSQEREQSRKGWANAGLADYLDAVARWTKNMEQAAQNTGMKVPENPDWQFIATLFHIGRIYE